MCIRDSPWNGPVVGVQVALIDGEVIINPTLEEFEASDLDLFLAGTATKINMIEAGANEVSEEKMLEAIEKGHEVIRDLCLKIEDMRREIGKEKFSYKSTTPPEGLFAAVKDAYLQHMREAVLSADKSVRDKAVSELSAKIREFIEKNYPEEIEYTLGIVDDLQKFVVRDYLLNEHRRVDGRQLNEIRKLSASVDLIPLVHGSALFSRGQTQVMTICTLGTVSEAQRLDGVDPRESKHYMHQYNFPSYSVGEARPNRSPGRREIGHGALAERALIPVLPDIEERCV